MRFWLVLLLLVAVGFSVTGCQKAPVDVQVPQLISPLEGDKLANGGSTCDGDVIWVFSWSEVPGAYKYQLEVMHLDEPMIRADVIDPEYVSYGDTYYSGLRLHGWTWRVRAGSETEWWAWSKVRTFSIEESGSGG